MNKEDVLFEKVSSSYLSPKVGLNVEDSHKTALPGIKRMIGVGDDRGQVSAFKYGFKLNVLSLMSSKTKIAIRVLLSSGIYVDS